MSTTYPKRSLGNGKYCYSGPDCKKHPTVVAEKNITNLNVSDYFNARDNEKNITAGIETKFLNPDVIRTFKSETPDNSWIENVTGEQLETIYDFSAFGSNEINWYLYNHQFREKFDALTPGYYPRGCEEKNFAEYRRKFLQKIAHLDDALKTAKIPERILYRGETVKYDSEKQNLADVLKEKFVVGDVIKKDSFSSLTSNPSTAAGFGGHVVFEILTNNAGDMGDITKYKENEFLLPRNAHLRIVNIQENVSIQKTRRPTWHERTDLGFPETNLPADEFQNYFVVQMIHENTTI